MHELLIDFVVFYTVAVLLVGPARIVAQDYPAFRRANPEASLAAFWPSVARWVVAGLVAVVAWLYVLHTH